MQQVVNAWGGAYHSESLRWQGRHRVKQEASRQHLNRVVRLMRRRHGRDNRRAAAE